MRQLKRNQLLLLLSATFWASLSLASISPTSPARTHQTEVTLSGLGHSEIEGRDAAHCQASRPAEPLATPDPLIEPFNFRPVAVSFIIGVDGMVHSPIILESAGTAEDARVLDALRAWRYRPATCNAAPTEMESKVEFTSR